MLGTMDEETAIAAEAKGINSSDFKALRDFIEQRYINKQARKIDLGDQQDKDFNTMGTEGDGEWEGDEGYYDNDLNALKGAKGKGKSGMGKNKLQCYGC